MCLFKKEFFDGLRFREGKINEDIDLKYKVLQRCERMVYSNQIKYFYFQAGDSISMGGLKRKDFDLYEAAEELNKMTSVDDYGQIRFLGDVKKKRTAFSLLCKIAYYGVADASLNKDELVKSLTKEHRSNVKTLLKSPMSMSQRTCCLIRNKLSYCRGSSKSSEKIFGILIMKIVTVGYLHGAGGAERQIILLSNQLALRGHEVVICVLAENKSPYPIDKKVRIVDISVVEHDVKSSIGKIYKRLVAFRKVIKQERPDIIIHYNLQSAYFCLTLSSKKRGKVIYSERGDPYDAEYSGLLGKIRDFTVKRMDGLVFQSEGARDFFPEEVKQKSIVIHNSVNVPQDKYPIPDVREKRIINVGRFHPQKNQKLLINAFAKISKSFPDYVLEMYGDGDLYDELKSR